MDRLMRERSISQIIVEMTYRNIPPTIDGEVNDFTIKPIKGIARKSLILLTPCFINV